MCYVWRVTDLVNTAQRSARSPGGLSIALSASLLTACQPRAELRDYSLPAGAIDDEATSLYDNLNELNPPAVGGGDTYPATPETTRVLAAKLKVENPMDQRSYSYGFSILSSSAWHDFYQTPTATDMPGVCQSKAVNFRDTTWDTDTVEGERYRYTVYGVAGSLAPLSSDKTASYWRRLNDACAERVDMATWARDATPRSFYRAALLTDLIIRAAKRSGPLSFDLVCEPFPADWPDKPRCSNPRRTLAGISPRAIVALEDCDFVYEVKGELTENANKDCTAVRLAKTTDSPSLRESEQWTLSIIVPENSTMVSEVRILDTVVTID